MNRTITDIVRDVVVYGILISFPLAILFFPFAIWKDLKSKGKSKWSYFKIAVFFIVFSIVAFMFYVITNFQ